jgi:predicted exporter
MFPERYFASDFWLFVAENAIDPRLEEGSDTRPSRVVSELLYVHSFLHGDNIAALLPALAASVPKANDDDHQPLLFATLQEALLAFLVYLVGKGGQPANGRFACTYDIWLRTVVLIMADIVHEPDALQQMTGERSRSNTWVSHRMQVGPSWECLSESTFDYVVRSLTPPAPLST